MKVQEITLLFEYNYWANHLLLSKAALVTPEQFVAPSSHSFSSLRDTLVHIMDTEYGWRSALQDTSSPELSPDDCPTAEAIQKRWTEEEQAMHAYLGGLSDDDVTNRIVRERVLWHYLFHIVNHGMQHRSEAAELLTRYGQSPGDIDFTLFLNQRK